MVKLSRFPLYMMSNSPCTVNKHDENMTIPIILPYQSLTVLRTRYYGCQQGKSVLEDCPVSKWSKDVKADLKYLSSRQALADLANFHAFATQKYGLSPQTKWISWGGSYPGMLAAWVRLKFPHLIHAAVSSSSPVRAKVEMTEVSCATTRLDVGILFVLCIHHLICPQHEAEA